MSELARVEGLSIPRDTRVICVSDIHGSLDLFQRLLHKINFNGDDLLLLLGGLYTKGPQSHETLKYVMELCKRPNVRALRGNCDWVADFVTDAERAWLEGLPHILNARAYVFVHGGLTSQDLYAQDARACMKNHAFMEQGLCFDNYIVTGHWPVNNYCHEIPCFNPIVKPRQRIIAIDGGNVLKTPGQINAFIIYNDTFSFDSVDDFPTYTVRKPQAESGGTINVTWLDRQIEIVGKNGFLSTIRHIKTGKTLTVPTECIWTDADGSLCECTYATDYCLPVETGEAVSAVKWFNNWLYAKKGGYAGWVIT
jgi:protein phosphatase